MKRVHKIVGLALAVATVAAIAGTTVLAQTATPEATQPRQRPPIGEGMTPQGRGGAFQGRNGATQEALAEALGMTVEELAEARADGQTVADLAEEKGLDLQDVKDAVDAARLEQAKAAIEAQVEAGKLTRERADWILEGLNAGWGQGLTGAASKGNGTGLEAAAKVLGMTLDELELQMWGGRTLKDLAERVDVELSAVTDAIKAAQQEAIRARIAEAVAAGDMTQAQADWLLRGIENGYMPGRPGMRGGSCMDGGRPMMNGERGGPMGPTEGQTGADAGTSA